MKSTKKYDIVIVTQDIYVSPTKKDQYIENVLLEDDLIIHELKKHQLKVYRTNWDNADFDWSSTQCILFRATWDYFHRFEEFEKWLKKVSQQTKLINPYEQILWNIDKHYLIELENKGINIVPTIAIERYNKESLHNIVNASGWSNLVLKPAISGGARHTYPLNSDNIQSRETIFQELIANESMLLQPFLEYITTKGEVSYMLFGGHYSHSVLKKVKKGDFRVQDDFGGSVELYSPSHEEIAFAESVVKMCVPLPLYARVDVVWDNNNNLALAEIELIEPELWFRLSENSSKMLAHEVNQYIRS